MSDHDQPRQHHHDIVEQFTAQASGFASSPSIRDAAALELLVRFAEVGGEDRVLDVACGPGLVACAFAALAREVVGIDVTPAMLEQARTHAAACGVTNVEWRLGEVPPIPWPERSFDVVVSRYAFHHMSDPLTVLEEMVRVCAPGGRVVVCDLAPAADKVDAFNSVDRLRDPSHAGALSLDGLRELYERAGLPPPRTTGYRLEGDLDALLARSFPATAADEQEVRRRFAAAVDHDDLDIDAQRDGERIRYRYPIAVLAATRAA